MMPAETDMLALQNIMNRVDPLEGLHLGAQPEVTGGQIDVSVHARLDGLDESLGGCRITLPEICTPTPRMAELLTVGAALGFAGLCAPRLVSLPFRIQSKRAAQNLQHIFQITTDARFVEISEYHGLPGNAVRLAFLPGRGRTKKTSIALKKKHVLQLYSGGIDSFASTLRLLEQGYKVTLLHVKGINIDGLEQEYESAAATARLLFLDLHVAEVNWPSLLSFGRFLNPQKFGHWPEYNAIPYGRDIVLLTIAGFLAVELGIQNIAVANDYESIEKKPFSVNGARLAVATELAARLAQPILRDFLANFIHPSLRLMFPIADMTKFSVVEYVATRHPEFISKLSSCEWGTWCGQCRKCLKYGALLSLYPEISLPFQRNPLNALASNIDALNIIDREMKNWYKNFNNN